MTYIGNKTHSFNEFVKQSSNKKKRRGRLGFSLYFGKHLISSKKRFKKKRKSCWALNTICRLRIIIWKQYINLCSCVFKNTNHILRRDVLTDPNSW